MLSFSDYKNRFELYYPNEEANYIEDIVKQIESNYNRILNDLSVSNMYTIKIIIYPSIKELHNSLCIEDGEEWMVGVALSSTEIRIVSPINPGSVHTYESIMKVIIHEFAHCVCLSIDSNLHRKCRWLSESIALYEAGQVRKIDIKKRIPTISELNRNVNEVYNWGYNLAECIINRWGKSALSDLVRCQGDLKQALGINEIELNEEFKNYIKYKYRL